MFKTDRHSVYNGKPIGPPPVGFLWLMPPSQNRATLLAGLLAAQSQNTDMQVAALADALVSAANAGDIETILLNRTHQLGIKNGGKTSGTGDVTDSHQPALAPHRLRKALPQHCHPPHTVADGTAGRPITSLPSAHLSDRCHICTHPFCCPPRSPCVPGGGLAFVALAGGAYVVRRRNAAA
jgi:hypothetical protein